MKTGVFLVLLVLLFAVTGAQAYSVTINIEATVTDFVDNGPNGGWLGGQVKVNDVIKGHYTYESTTPDSFPSDPTYASYLQTGAGSGIFLSTASGLVLQSSPSAPQFTVDVVNDWYGLGYGIDGYGVRSTVNAPVSSGAPIAVILWQLEADRSMTALTSDALPTTAPDLNAWKNGNRLFIDGDGLNGGFGIGAIVTKSEVPEPATLLLLGAGFIITIRKK